MPEFDFIEKFGFGYFDLIVIILLIIINLIIWKVNVNYKLGCFVVGFFYGFIIPFVSQYFEIQKATERQEIMDSFELLYTYLRFPMYWFLGIFQNVIFSKFKDLDFSEND